MNNNNELPGSKIISQLYDLKVAGIMEQMFLKEDTKCRRLYFNFYMSPVFIFIWLHI